MDQVGTLVCLWKSDELIVTNCGLCWLLNDCFNEKLSAQGASGVQKHSSPRLKKLRPSTIQKKRE